MRGAVLVASLVGMLLAGSVGAAATARVTITDAALTPKVARISAPGSVTWTNKGTLPHYVASTTGAFQFLLNVGKSKTVRFARPAAIRTSSTASAAGSSSPAARSPGRAARSAEEAVNRRHHRLRRTS